MTLYDHHCDPILSSSEKAKRGRFRVKMLHWPLNRAPDLFPFPMALCDQFGRELPSEDEDWMEWRRYIQSLKDQEQGE